MAVLFALAEILGIGRDGWPPPGLVGDRNARRIVQVLLAQHVAQRTEIGHGEPGRQLVPDHEAIEQRERSGIDDREQRFGIVLARDQPDQAACRDRQHHDDTEKARHDAGLRRQHGGAEEHHEREQVDGAALYANPFRIVGDEPRQDDVEPPPRRKEEIRPGMLDHAFGDLRLPAVDHGKIAVARAEHRPIEVSDQCEICERPERPPIGIGAIAEREDVKAECGRQQDGRHPDREDDPIIVGRQAGTLVDQRFDFGAGDRQHHQDGKQSEGKPESFR